MGFRDDQLAGHERARSLEQEVERLEAENAALRAKGEGPEERQAPQPARRFAGTAGAFALLALVAAALVPIPQGRILLVITAALLLFVAVLLGVVGSLLHVVQPGELLVLSGMPHTGPAGEARGYRIVRGGRVLRTPLLETATRMALGPFPITLELRDVYARRSAVDLRASAAVAVSSDERFVHNAVERFLGRPTREIVEVARQTVEGALREVVAELTADELQSDPMKVAARLSEELDPDLERLGLSLDTIVLEDVTAR